MPNSKLDYIWNFLRENNRDGDGTTPEDVKCTICRKIMINVHSGVCGCRYCLDCVTNQTKGGANHCPGKKHECKEELLDMHKTVHPDNAANQKIAGLIVKCPQDRCDFEAELKNMAEHEKTCQKRDVGCPYCPIGCLERQLVRDEIDEHFALANESHGDLLMEFLGVLYRENLSMVSGFKNLTEQVSKMEQELQATKEENESLKSQIDKNGRECSGLVDAMELERRVSERQAAEIMKSRKKHRKIKARVVELEQQLKIEKELRDKIDGEGDKRHLKGFEWRIDQWAAVAESLHTAEDADNIAREEGGTQEIFSEAFFSHENGYKMCLSVGNDGNYLLVRFHIMQGPHDDALAWPFAGTATVSIVNQVTRRNVYQDKIDSGDCPDDRAWQRPVSERNVGMGTSALAEMDNISRDLSVCQNDRIFIRCHVASE